MLSVYWTNWEQDIRWVSMKRKVTILILFPYWSELVVPVSWSSKGKDADDTMRVWKISMDTTNSRIGWKSMAWGGSSNIDHSLIWRLCKKSWRLSDKVDLLMTMRSWCYLMIITAELGVVELVGRICDHVGEKISRLSMGASCMMRTVREWVMKAMWCGVGVSERHSH